MANNFQHSRERITDEMERRVIAGRPGQVLASLNLMYKSIRRTHSATAGAASVSYATRQAEQLPQQQYFPYETPQITPVVNANVAHTVDATPQYVQDLTNESLEQIRMQVQDSFNTNVAGGDF